MNYFPEDRCHAMWDYITEILAREQNFGGTPPVPGGGTNLAGRLQTVAAVGKTTYPDFLKFPYVGIQFRNFTENLRGARRFHEFSAFFDIIAIIEVDAIGEGVLKLDNAWSALRPIVNDGNGNGITPILRDDQYYNLGVNLNGNGEVNASMHTITDVSYNWDQTPAGAGSIYIAFASITLKAMFEQKV